MEGSAAHRSHAAGRSRNQRDSDRPSLEPRAGIDHRQALQPARLSRRNSRGVERLGCGTSTRADEDGTQAIARAADAEGALMATRRRTVADDGLSRVVEIEVFNQDMPKSEYEKF